MSTVYNIAGLLTLDAGTLFSDSTGTEFTVSTRGRYSYAHADGFTTFHGYHDIELPITILESAA